MKTFTYEDRELIRDRYTQWEVRSDPYGYFPNWSDYFSPIESLLWGEIRGCGLPFYPQYPVLDFFIDFADPERKIGLEADGEEFHQDEAFDRGRQQLIEAQGWVIYRVSGKKIMRERQEYETPFDFHTPQEIIRDSLLDGGYADLSEILTAIKILHYEHGS